MRFLLPQQTAFCSQPVKLSASSHRQRNPSVAHATVVDLLQTGSGTFAFTLAPGPTSAKLYAAAHPLTTYVNSLHLFGPPEVTAARNSDSLPKTVNLLFPLKRFKKSRT
jgi:hypothetical protein